MNTTKITFYLSTGLLTVLMLFSAGMYLFTHDAIVSAFEHLGYPAYLIYPLAIAKILGLIAIWSNVSSLLKYLAYAGFFYDTLLAWTAHIMAGDGFLTLALFGVMIVIVSFISERKFQGRSSLV